MLDAEIEKIAGKIFQSMTVEDSVQKTLAFLYQNSDATQEKIAKKIGQSRSVVSRYLTIPNYRKDHKIVIELFAFFGFNIILKSKSDTMEKRSGYGN